MSKPVVLILGANADVAKALIKLYVKDEYHVVAASRNLDSLKDFRDANGMSESDVEILYFDAADFNSHGTFYKSLKSKPTIVVYAAGFLRNNEEALRDWEGSYLMINVHYAGAISILNIIAMDEDNHALKRIIGLSSLSGVRGRKSNFIYGSTKAAFTQYLAGLRQYLHPKKVTVNVIVAGYIRSKMTAGLNLPESLMLEPEFIARSIVSVKKKFVTVPGVKWKIIYQILKVLPERLVAKLP